MDGPSSLMRTVKLGEDGKEKALLVRRRAGRWLCALATVLLLVVCGAWFMHDHHSELKGETSRLTKLVRSTGERLQTLRRVSDRLKATNYSGEIKAKLARELKLDSEVHHAEEEHVLAQAGMMKQGLQPTDTHAEAADKAAQTVPVDIQRAMLAEFHVKANFLLWATSPRNEVVWRQSPHFGKLPSSEVEEEMEEMEELYEDGDVHTATIVAWLRGNISAGIYPPPVMVLSGISGYIEELCDYGINQTGVGLFVDYDKQKNVYRKHNSFYRSSGGGEDAAGQVAEATIQRLLALAGDEVTWHTDPTPTFKKIYAALLQFHLTEWLFNADYPGLDEGLGLKFIKYKGISELADEDDWTNRRG